jgi:hypothetical protein
VEPVHKLLRRALSETAEVKPWPEQFPLTKTYIEALESLLDTSDFAVLVLTPDDRTTSRETERPSPRDNVVFELGLFLGQLGRDRCFLIQSRDLNLKLPSDLLGVESATYSLSPDQDLETALNPACARIEMAIRNAMTTLPSRPRLGDAERAAQAAMRRFSDRIKGTWWERIRLKDEKPALSFVTIELDEAHSSVRLNGKAYGPDGKHRANWRSVAVRLEGNGIVYLRECLRFDAPTQAWLPGKGEITFDDSGGVIDLGDGKFSEYDESHLEHLITKFVDLQRNHDESHALKMQKGSEAERQAVVQKKLRAW